MFQYRASFEFRYLIDKDMMMQFGPPTSLLLGELLLKIAFNDCQPSWKGSFILSFDLQWLPQHFCYAFS